MDHILKLPLKLIWALRKTNGNVPVIAGDTAFFATGTKGATRCVAVNVKDGRELWAYGTGDDWYGPHLTRGAELLVYVRKKPGYHVLEVSSGKAIRKLRCIPRSSPVAWENLVVGCNVALEAIDAETGRTAWVLDFSKGDLSEGIKDGFALAGPQTVFGLWNGDILCVETRTGKEVWRATVRDLTWDDPRNPKTGCVSGEIAIFEDRAIINVSRHHIVCLSLKDGRRLWHHEGFVDQGCLVGHEYITRLRDVVDVRTGERRPVPTPQRIFSEKARNKMVAAGTICGTATHIFEATWSGYIWAWERSTGDVVWCERPPGATGAFNWGRTFTIQDGRLYYVDTNWTVYCFESDTDPAPGKVSSSTGRIAKGNAADAKRKRGAKASGLSRRKLATLKKRTGAKKA